MPGVRHHLGHPQEAAPQIVQPIGGRVHGESRGGIGERMHSGGHAARGHQRREAIGDPARQPVCPEPGREQWPEYMEGRKRAERSVVGPINFQQPPEPVRGAERPGSGRQGQYQKAPEDGGRSDPTIADEAPELGLRCCRQRRQRHPGVGTGVKRNAPLERRPPPLEWQVSFPAGLAAQEAGNRLVNHQPWPEHEGIRRQTMPPARSRRRVRRQSDSGKRPVESEPPLQVQSFKTDHQRRHPQPEHRRDDPDAGGHVRRQEGSKQEDGEAGVDWVGKPTVESARDQLLRRKGIHRQSASELPKFPHRAQHHATAQSD